MIFKSIRNLIFSRLELVIGDVTIENVDVNDPAIDIYDYYEVIGIRAGVDIYTKEHFDYDDYEEKLIISLKSTITSYYENTATTKARDIYESGCSCKK